LWKIYEFIGGIGMLKRLSIFFIIFLLALSTFGFTTSAANKEKERVLVLYEREEIKDIDKLFERAKNNISDINEKKNKFSASLENNNTKQKDDLTILSTTQLLKSVKKNDGTIVNSYSTTVFAVTPSADGSGSKNKNGWDSSYGIEAYSTYYYDYYNKSGGTSPGEYRDLTSVKGGWKIHDSTISLSNRKVTLGASGTSYNGYYVQQITDKYPTGNSFSYSAPSSWEPVYMSNGSVGVTTTVTLKRGSSTWTLTLRNNN
jgi:hypothetical protein